jgi:Papain-like cysteine protease AvrRpt2
MKNVILITLLFCLTFEANSQKNIRKKSSPKPVIDIYYNVPFVPQPNGFSCWSSSMSMILWWCKNNKSEKSFQSSLSPRDVAFEIDYYKQYYQKGLDVLDENAFDHFGFVKIPNTFTSQKIDYYVSLIKKGPIWIAYNGCENPVRSCGHSVVWIGLKGDGTHEGTKVIVHDPDDGSGKYPNQGIRNYEMTLKEFEERLAYLAIGVVKSNRNVNSKNICYMAYKDCSKKWFETIPAR